MILTKDIIKTLIFEKKIVEIEINDLEKLKNFFEELQKRNIKYEDKIYIIFDVENKSEEEIKTFLNACNNYYFHLILKGKENLIKFLEKVLIIEKNKLFNDQNLDKSNKLDSINIRIKIYPLISIIKSIVNNYEIEYEKDPILSKHYSKEFFKHLANSLKMKFSEEEIKYLKELRKNYINNLFLIKKFEKGLI